MMNFELWGIDCNANFFTKDEIEIINSGQPIKETYPEFSYIADVVELVSLKLDEIDFNNTDTVVVSCVQIETKIFFYDIDSKMVGSMDLCDKCDSVIPNEEDKYGNDFWTHKLHCPLSLVRKIQNV